MVLATSSSFSAQILRQSQSESVLFTRRHSRIMVRWKEGRWGTLNTAADLKRGCARGKTKNLQQQIRNMGTIKGQAEGNIVSEAICHS